MGDAVWFYHNEGRQIGPVSWTELKDLAARGEVDPDDLVWQPELADWEPAGTQEGLFTQSAPDSEIERNAPAVWGSRTPERSPSSVKTHLKPAESILRAYGRALSAPTLDRFDDGMAIIGQIAYLFAAILAAIFMLVVGIQHREISSIILAIAGIPAAFMLTLASAKVLAALRRRIELSPSDLDERSIPDALATFAIGFGVLVVANGVALIVTSAGLASVLGSFGASILLFYSAGVALEPATINVRFKKDTSDGNCVATLSFISKIIFLRLPSIAFTIMAISAAVMVVTLFVTSIGDSGLAPGWVTSLVWARVLAISLLPLAAWLIFVVVWTTLEVARSLIVDRIDD
jgi:hypothetical protein